MTARDVIAQALALSEAATEGAWEAVADDHGRGRPLEHSVWAGSDDGGYVAEWIETGPDAEFIAAARVLVPAFAKALGDVLDVFDDLAVEGFGGATATVRIHRAITAALSEVAP